MVDRRTLLKASALAAVMGVASPAVAAQPIQIAFPPALKKGDLIGITSPSAGVKESLRPRMEFFYQNLRRLGYRYVEGDCLWGKRLTSAPARARAEELTRMLLDDRIAAVFPPNGGEILIDILPFLDFDALA
jgi:muramoyltetrapeptide carboxypeptidase LdcA involved in peptidoglycan recycling